MLVYAFPGYLNPESRAWFCDVVSPVYVPLEDEQWSNVVGLKAPYSLGDLNAFGSHCIVIVQQFRVSVFACVLTML